MPKYIINGGPGPHSQETMGTTLAGERVGKLLWKHTSQLVELRARCEIYLKSLAEAIRKECVLDHDLLFLYFEEKQRSEYKFWNAFLEHYKA